MVTRVRGGGDVQVSVLPREQAGLAELDPTQPVAERVLRQGGARRQEAGQGQLLDARPGQLQHVRQRQLPAPAATLQEERCAERARGTRPAAAAADQRRPSGHV